MSAELSDEQREACMAVPHATEFGNHSYRYNARLCQSCDDLSIRLAMEVQRALTPDDTCWHDRPCGDGEHSARCVSENSNTRVAARERAE